jgi:hypothetical protein
VCVFIVSMGVQGVDGNKTRVATATAIFANVGMTSEPPRFGQRKLLTILR